MHKIDDNIPIPTTSRANPQDTKTGVLRILKVGQSVFFPGIKNMTGFIRNIKLDPATSERQFTGKTVEEPDPTWDPIEAAGESEENQKAPLVRGIRVWRVADKVVPPVNQE